MVQLELFSIDVVEEMYSFWNYLLRIALVNSVNVSMFFVVYNVHVLLK